MRSLLLTSCLMLTVMIGCSTPKPISSSAGERSGHPEPGYISRSIVHGGRVYPYTVYRPRDLDRSRTAPALIFLHGAGECGTDGSKPLAVGLPPAMMLEPGRWPFVVIIPQKPTVQSEWEDHAEAVIAMLDRTIREENVNPDRVAVTGLSQGGHGTIAIASRYPDRFRAAAPVCGYVARYWQPDGERRPSPKPEGDARRALTESFGTTPVWVFHGEKDRVVPPLESRWLDEALREGGAASKLTIFPDNGHNSWDSAYRESGVWDWLAEQTRAR